MSQLYSSTSTSTLPSTSTSSLTQPHSIAALSVLRERYMAIEATSSSFMAGILLKSSSSSPSCSYSSSTSISPHLQELIFLPFLPEDNDLINNNSSSNNGNSSCNSTNSSEKSCNNTENNISYQPPTFSANGSNDSCLTDRALAIDKIVCNMQRLLSLFTSIDRRSDTCLSLLAHCIHNQSLLSFIDTYLLYRKFPSIFLILPIEIDLAA